MGQYYWISPYCPLLCPSCSMILLLNFGVRRISRRKRTPCFFVYIEKRPNMEIWRLHQLSWRRYPHKFYQPSPCSFRWENDLCGQTIEMTKTSPELYLFRMSWWRQSRHQGLLCFRKTTLLQNGATMSSWRSWNAERNLSKACCLFSTMCLHPTCESRRGNIGKHFRMAMKTRWKDGALLWGMQQGKGKLEVANGLVGS